MQEPTDGDFVAYVEALQRESALRLSRQHLGIAQAGFPASAAGSLATNEPANAPSSVAPPQPAAGTPALRRRDERLFKALVAAVIGFAFLLSWMGGGGFFSFIIGVVLLAYAAPRLVATYREQARAPDNRAAIDQVFGRSATSITGRKR